MNFSEYLDEYCERIAPGLLNEPLNFFSNASFFIAAIFFLRQCRTQRIETKQTRILGWLVLTIGVGSSLFHSVATRWAKMADVIPIGIFVLVFTFLFLRDVLRWKPLAIASGFLSFFLLTLACALAFDPVFFNRSQSYFATFISTFLLSLAASKVSVLAAKNLRRSGTAFAAALLFRTIDPRICDAFPFGTHFLWHLLNGLTIYFALQAYISPRDNES